MFTNEVANDWFVATISATCPQISAAKISIAVANCKIALSPAVKIPPETNVGVDVVCVNAVNPPAAPIAKPARRKPLLLEPFFRVVM